MPTLPLVAFRLRMQSLTRWATLALGLTLLSLNAAAQDLPEPGDGFDWERLDGATPDAQDLAFVADGDGDPRTLWVESGSGLYRLDFSGGTPAEWVLVNDRTAHFRILPLGGDTLVATKASSTWRSLDGGATWAQVHDEGFEGLYEIPSGYARAGRLFSGDYGGVPDSRAIAFSDDRGATWALAAIPERSGAEAFVTFPPGSPYAGRILTAGSWGMMFSDDGGASFRRSGLWEEGRYEGHGICLVERPDDGGGLRALAFGFDATESELRFWASDDGGETWADVGGLLEAGYGGSGAGLFALGGASALAVGRGGTVYRTDDAGATWVPVGRAPEISDLVSAATAELGPDRRLYIGLAQIGANSAPVYRTEPLVAGPVPTEPEAPAPPEESVGVELRPNPASGPVEVVLTLRSAAAVEVAVYDGLGRKVTTLQEGALPAGERALRLAIAALPAGVYFVRVTAHTLNGAATATAPLTLVR